MLLIDTKSASQPSRITLEKLDGRCKVILADNIKQMEEDVDGVGFAYDEVVFYMPTDRHDTLSEIEANFNDWWEYGKVNYKEPTLEERVSDIENLLLAMTEE